MSRKRKYNISFRVNEEEREIINKALNNKDLRTFFLQLIQKEKTN